MTAVGLGKSPICPNSHDTNSLPAALHQSEGELGARGGGERQEDAHSGTSADRSVRVAGCS